MIVITDDPIALDSADHTNPSGTKNDNHTSHGLLDELAALIKRPYSLLDIGCAGGQFVIDCAARGNVAVGLEGSDYSVKHQRANWPEHHGTKLFTCDVRKPYGILYDDGCPFLADVITAWEVMEHFHPHEIEGVLRGIWRHLRRDGIFLCSVSIVVDDDWSVGHHRSAHLTEAEWAAYFEKDFRIAPYPFKHSPREDCRTISRWHMLTRK